MMKVLFTYFFCVCSLVGEIIAPPPVEIREMLEVSTVETTQSIIIPKNDVVFITVETWDVILQMLENAQESWMPVTQVSLSSLPIWPVAIDDFAASIAGFSVQAPNIEFTDGGILRLRLMINGDLSAASPVGLMLKNSEDVDANQRLIEKSNERNRVFGKD